MLRRMSLSALFYVVALLLSLHLAGSASGMAPSRAASIRGAAADDAASRSGLAKSGLTVAGLASFNLKAKHAAYDDPPRWVRSQRSRHASSQPRFVLARYGHHGGHYGGHFGGHFGGHHGGHHGGHYYDYGLSLIYPLSYYYSPPYRSGHWEVRRRNVVVEKPGPCFSTKQSVLFTDGTFTSFTTNRVPVSCREERVVEERVWVNN